MSSEWEIVQYSLGNASVLEPTAADVPIDRVLLTAGDRPLVASLPALVDPAADHEEPAADPLSRRGDVEEKHRRVRAFLDAHNHDALVLARSDSVAWFTAGGDLSRHLASERAAVMLFITRTSRAVVTDNVQSARVFEEEVAGLGFQIKERPWYECPERLISELGHHKDVAADIPLPPWPNALTGVRSLRQRLTRRERQLMRELGRTITVAVEATCRNFMPGETEADVAGHLAHRLIREGVVPVDLRVASDDRLDRYRQPTFKAAPIRKRATITVVGRRHGLCAGVTRTVSFGPIDPEFRAAYDLAAMIDAICIFFSRPGETVKDVFRRAKRIYEKFSRTDEWTLAYQGCLTGYEACEDQLHPETSLKLEADMPIRWSPSVGSARSEDTVVVDARGYEVVTEAQDWPKLEIAVKGYSIKRPGVLERPILG